MMSLLQGSNLWFTIAFVVVAVLLRWRRVPWGAWGGIYVSLGILGTFWGILIALLGFNTNDIETSVPALIDGMKTAFATSVVGTTVAIITRLADLLRPRHVDETAPRPQDYLATMRAQTAALAAIKAGIGGDNDSSLLVQVQKLRLDMQDFMKKLSSQSTDAIVEALKEVIKDFNAKINEQFGDNFKQLNEAVGRLVGWMDGHQELVTKSHDQLKQAIVAMEVASGVIQSSGDALKAVSNELGAIRVHLGETAHVVRQLPPTLERIRGSLENLSGSAESLTENVARLGAVVDTLTAANANLAVAMEHWTALAEETPAASEAIRGMVESVRAHAEAVTQEQRQLIAALRAQIVTLAADLTTAQQGLLVGLRQGLAAELQSLTTGLRTSQTKLLGELETALTESGNRNHEAIDKQIRALDEALGKELSEALKLLGGKLGSLSQQFVNDYGPLTEQLSQVVKLASTIEAERRAGRPNV